MFLVLVVVVAPKNVPTVSMIPRKSLPLMSFIQMAALIIVMDAVIYAQVDQLPIAVIIRVGFHLTGYNFIQFLFHTHLPQCITIGVETGDGEILEFMNKDYSPEDIVNQSARLDTAYITYNYFYLTGISGAGREKIGLVDQHIRCPCGDHLKKHPRQIICQRCFWEIALVYFNPSITATKVSTVCAPFMASFPLNKKCGTPCICRV